MKYNEILKGIFVSRPNRFIANVLIDGKPYVCHVKNTGRCRELLVEGCTVYLEKSGNALRKTAYDIVAVQKGSRLINMDSQAPNKAVREWLEETKPFGEGMIVLPEKTFGKSRFDFLLESPSGKRLYLEVKGCTLEIDGVVKFPDAPTQRGVKHVRELMACKGKGMDAALLILVQMSDVEYFTPNYDTDPEFGKAMKEAKKAGVRLMCYDCAVTPDSMTVGKPVRIIL